MNSTMHLHLLTLEHRVLIVITIINNNKSRSKVYLIYYRYTLLSLCCQCSFSLLLHAPVHSLTYLYNAIILDNFLIGRYIACACCLLLLSIMIQSQSFLFLDFRTTTTMAILVVCHKLKTWVQNDNEKERRFHDASHQVMPV